jgi:translation initiation factor 2 gamma subunit (eIF-2gamma)
LAQSACVEICENIDLSRRLGKYRFIGWGKVLEGGDII